MHSEDIAKLSARVLLAYYNNDIEPFLDACHPNVLWIGPGEGQIIQTQETIRNTFYAEKNNLTFAVHDLSVTALPTGSPSVLEVVMMFLVDTFWPNGATGRVSQRIHLSWVGCKETPRILLCHISNAIAYDERDTIYPLHYDETFGTEMHYEGAPASGRVCLRAKGHTTMYLDHEHIIYAESHGRHTLVHTSSGTYEATESLSAIIPKQWPPRPSIISSKSQHQRRCGIRTGMSQRPSCDFYPTLRTVATHFSGSSEKRRYVESSDVLRASTPSKSVRAPRPKPSVSVAPVAMRVS